MNNNNEQEPKKYSRRKFTQLAAGGAIGATVASAIGLPALGLYRSLSAEREIGPISHEEMFGRLFDNIGKSAGSEIDKTKAKEIATNLQTIVRVNDKFIDNYKSDIGKSGKPRLRELYEAKYARYAIDDPGGMIPFVANDRLATDIIINPLVALIGPDTHISHRNISDIKTQLDFIGQVLRDSSEGQGVLEFDPNPKVGLKDYARVGTKKERNLEIKFKDGINVEEREKLEADAVNIRSILKPFPIPGNMRITLGTDTNGLQQIEVEDITNVNLRDQDEITVVHEVVGHGFDPLANPIQLWQCMTPSAIYNSMLLREEALSSDEWGRDYSDTKKVFGPNYNSASNVLSSKVLRQSISSYPDGIFATGFQNGRTLNVDPWIQRKQDEPVTRELKGIFERDNKLYGSLSEFRRANSDWFQTQAEKSRWLAEVDKEITSLPELDNTGWLPEVDFKIPHGLTAARHWYEYYIKIGQRIAFIQMLNKKSKALNILSGEEFTSFRRAVLKPAALADKELFAEMTAQSIIKSRSGFIAAQTGNPYLKHYEIVSQTFASVTD